jgi:hypothetical protein
MAKQLHVFIACHAQHLRYAQHRELNAFSIYGSHVCHQALCYKDTDQMGYTEPTCLEGRFKLNMPCLLPVKNLTRAFGTATPW